jgi:hypothetical protein
VQGEPLEMQNPLLSAPEQRTVPLPYVEREEVKETPYPPEEPRWRAGIS